MGDDCGSLSIPLEMRTLLCIDSNLMYRLRRNRFKLNRGFILLRLTALTRERTKVIRVPLLFPHGAMSRVNQVGTNNDRAQPIEDSRQNGVAPVVGDAGKGGKKWATKLWRRLRPKRR